MLNQHKIKHSPLMSQYIIAFVCTILFAFNFWLFYPGYITHDWGLSLNDLPLSNWLPVIYFYLLRIISDIAGYHIWYSLLFNLIPWYLGIYTLVLGFYNRFQSQWCWLGLLPLILGNIFFNNILLHSSFSSPMIIFMLWAIVLYQILTRITVKNLTAFIIVFVLALCSRHNAIVQIYPICFIYAYFIIQKLKFSHKLLAYIEIYLSLTILTGIIAYGIPRTLQTYVAHPETHIFLHQIAGACVPHNDENCFKPNWYRKEKTFEDVKKEYLADPTNADRMNFNCFHDHPFKSGYLPDLQSMWLKAIFKYPHDYLRYINRFRQKMWHAQTPSMEISLSENMHCLHASDCEKLKSKYPEHELFYQNSIRKIKFYNLFKKILPQVPTFVFIGLNFIIAVFAGILFMLKKNIFSLYSLSSAIAGISASILFCSFTPTIYARYTYPIIISTLMAVIGIFLAFLDKQKNMS